MSELVLSTSALWVREELKPWVHATIGMLALLLLCLIAGQFDGRTLYDVSVWTKPAKFALSLAVYFATLVWFAHYIDRGFFEQKAGRTLVWLPVICAWFEMIYIIYQASLGEPSHFNTGTPFHATMYALMGVGAVTLVSVLVWYGYVIVRRNTLMNSQMNHMVLALVLGLGLSFVLGGGFGGYLSSSGGHWVNAPATDAGGSLLFGWARQGGDLRVAHFFGMHAMQALPLFACTLSSKWSEHTKIACVVAFAAAYSAFTVMTFMQAVSGQPFGSGL